MLHLLDSGDPTPPTPEHYCGLLRAARAAKSSSNSGCFLVYGVLHSSRTMVYSSVFGGVYGVTSGDSSRSAG